MTNSGYERNDEYEYQDKRYVRVMVFMDRDDSKFEDVSTCNSGEYMWFEVQPIKWIIRKWMNFQQKSIREAMAQQHQSRSDHRKHFFLG